MIAAFGLSPQLNSQHVAKQRVMDRHWRFMGWHSPPKTAPRSPTRYIARHPRPANDSDEGSPVRAADSMAMGSWRNEPSADRRSAAVVLALAVASLRYFLGWRPSRCRRWPGSPVGRHAGSRLVIVGRWHRGQSGCQSGCRSRTACEGAGKTSDHPKSQEEHIRIQSNPTGRVPGRLCRNLDSYKAGIAPIYNPTANNRRGRRLVVLRSGCIPCWC